MPAVILIASSSVDGHTRTICERLRQWLAATGQEVVLATIEETAELDLSPYAKNVVGTSIRYGHHRDNVLAFAARAGTRPGSIGEA